MDREEAIRLLRGGRDGMKEWNRRRESGEIIPSLNAADLSYTDLCWVNLSAADLSNANLVCTDLGAANLSGVNLSGAMLNHVDASKDLPIFGQPRIAGRSGIRVVRASLGGGNLGGVICEHANFTGVDLRGASLSRGDFVGTNFSRTRLSGADFSGARCLDTIFANVDLSEVTGLDSIQHLGPSTVGIDALIDSKGKIPEVFLRGCGVPESVIANRFALIGAMEPIQFYSCFISYSTKDDNFAKRLHARMVEEKLRVWFAPEDMQGGKKLHEQVDRAIQVHDRLLLVLSEESINSKWVKDEIRRARKAEVREARRKLFPIRLVDFNTIEAWECFDADLALAHGPTSRVHRPAGRALRGQPSVRTVEPLPTTLSVALTPSWRRAHDAAGAFPFVESLFAATRRDGAAAHALGDSHPIGPAATAPDPSLPRSSAARRPEDTPTAPDDDAWLPPRS